jgi:hypothetical protein
MRRLIVGLVCGLLFAPVAAPAQEPTMSDAKAVAGLLDERKLIEIADAIDRAVDAKDWALTRSYFAEEIRVSLPGSQPTTMPSAELVGAWEKNLYAEKPSFHLRGNHLVTIEGDTAKLVSSGYAWNKVEGLEDGDSGRSGAITSMASSAATVLGR